MKTQESVFSGSCGSALLGFHCTVFLPGVGLPLSSVLWLVVSFLSFVPFLSFVVAFFLSSLLVHYFLCLNLAVLQPRTSPFWWLLSRANPFVGKAA